MTAGPPCGSFTYLNLGTSLRSQTRPLGGSREYVKQANRTLVFRTSACVCFGKDCDTLGAPGASGDGACSGVFGGAARMYHDAPLPICGLPPENLSATPARTLEGMSFAARLNH